MSQHGVPRPSHARGLPVARSPSQNVSSVREPLTLPATPMTYAVRHQLLARIEELPPFPTDTDLAPVVALLADSAQLAAKRPLGSLMALLRHVADALAPAVRERLVDLTTTELDARRRVPDTYAAAAVPPTGRWYTLPEAAARLGIGSVTLLRRLERPEHRRRLGYPQWDGRQWRFPSPVLDPDTFAAALAALPDQEPLEELLPDWCIRDGREMAPQDARTEEERATLRRRGNVGQWKVA